MKTNTLTLLGMSGTALGAAVAHAPSGAPFGYTAGSPASIANLKANVENVVWILLENRAFDNILGGVKNPGLDNVVNNGPFWNPQNVSDPNSPKYYSQYKDYDSVLNDPDHSVVGNNFEFYGTESPDNNAIANGTLTPAMKGFVERELSRYPSLTPQMATKEVMGYYSQDEIPTLVDLVNQFTTFNYWYSCVPGPTNPNRLCSVAGTPDGHGHNDNSFDVSAITINSIFQTASQNNITWRNYDGTNGAFLSDAMFFQWVAQNAKQDVVPLESFFQDAYLGKLPQLSYINPSCCGQGTNSMHPSGEVSTGQVLVKQIYDALRASPQWDKTLLLITYDEAGGFFDHMAPPRAVRPDNKTYTESTASGGSYTLNFDRLGGRMPTWLVSPHTPAGHIENNGTDPVTGQSAAYTATSVLKTLGYLWDIQDFSPRVSHSPSFDHLIGPSARPNTPQTLTNPHPFAA